MDNERASIPLLEMCLEPWIFRTVSERSKLCATLAHKDIITFSYYVDDYTFG